MSVKGLDKEISAFCKKSTFYHRQTVRLSRMEEEEGTSKSMKKSIIQSKKDVLIKQNMQGDTSVWLWGITMPHHMMETLHSETVQCLHNKKRLLYSGDEINWAIENMSRFGSVFHVRWEPEQKYDG